MSPDPESNIWGQLILIVVLTLINAFFSAAEIAVVSINRTRIEGQADDGDKRAIKLVTLLKDPSNFLATIQVGITFAGFLSSASAATTLANRLSPVFGDASWAKEVSVIVVTVILSYVSLVFGELYPKRVALQRTEAIAKASVGPISAIGVVMRPFVWFLTASTNVLAKLTPMKFDDTEPTMTRDEMVSVIETGKKHGIIESNEFEMLEGIISLHTKMVREVMVPRTDAFMLDLDDDNDKNIDAILGERFSRIPIYQGDKDQIVGIVHIKNLLKRARQFGFNQVTIKDVMQEPLFIPETMLIDDLLFEMKKKQMQMAILLDEYGGVVGLATIEDLLEEIVGEIDDESDEAELLYHRINDHEYLVQGRMNLDDFNDLFETEIETTEVDTIAGFMLTQLGTIPDEDEHLSITLDNGLELITETMEGSRLLEIKVLIPEKLEAAIETNQAATEEK